MENLLNFLHKPHQVFWSSVAVCNVISWTIPFLSVALKRAGKLAHLKALLVGAFDDMHESSIPLGMTPKEIIYEKVKDYGYPVLWDFPAGHIDDNQAIIFG